MSSRCFSSPHFLALNCLALWPGHNNYGLPSDPERLFSPSYLKGIQLNISLSLHNVPLLNVQKLISILTCTEKLNHNSGLITVCCL